MQLDMALNHEFQPTAFFMDDSDAELASVRAVYPNTHVRLCFFHLTEAWRRWLIKHVHDPELSLNISDSMRCMAHVRAPAQLATLKESLLTRLTNAKQTKVRSVCVNLVCVCSILCMSVSICVCVCVLVYLCVCVCTCDCLYV